MGLVRYALKVRATFYVIAVLILVSGRRRLGEIIGLAKVTLHFVAARQALKAVDATIEGG